MSPLRLLVQYHAEEHIKHNDPFGWCERVYKEADWDELDIPWAALAPNPNLIRWFREAGWEGRGQKALVVGCGLGDDAEHLTRRGFDVTAFDISPTAIEWCRRRFPESKVKYEESDLFNTPESYKGGFDLVVEAFTLQSFMPPLRVQATKHLASFLAPGGLLWVITRGKEVDEIVEGPPWPLNRVELSALRRHDLEQVSFQDFVEPNDEGPKRRFLATYRAPRADM